MPARARKSTPKKSPAATRRKSLRPPQWLTPLIRSALALFAFCALYPVRYHAAAAGLDPSWAVALNQFHVRGLVHGKDIGLTYGPLAYLTLPMPFGSNLEQGIAFQLCCWILFGGLLAWIVISKQIPLSNLAAFALCAPAAARIIHEFGYAGPDVFLEFVALLFMGACLAGPEWLYYLGVAIAPLLMLIKLSTGIAAISAMIVFALAVALFDTRRGLRLLAISIVAIPALFVILFVALAGPFDAIVPYVHSAMEISSGHSAALSLPGPDRELYFALTIIAGFIALAAAFYMRKDRAFPIAAAMIAPLFLEFKHSFIRQDSGHLEFVFTFAAFAFGATLLFADITSRRTSARQLAISLATIALIAAPWLYFEQGRYWRGLISPRGVWLELSAFTDFGDLKKSLIAASSQALTRDSLPSELLTRIGDHSITIYPWENAIAAANNINYRPFPIFQVYDAYTAYLDSWNSAFLEDPARKPDFVLFEWAAIDQRHPLLDCPQTLLSLYANYEFDSQFGGYLLLQKRLRPMTATPHHVTSKNIQIDRPLHITTTQPALVRIHLRHNVTGWLQDFLFRVPPVYITLATQRGQTLVARIPPGVIPGGIPLSIVPEDLSDMRRLFESGTINQRWDTIAIAGPGSHVFAATAEAEIFDLPQVTVKEREGTPSDISKLRDAGWLSDARIESVNGTGVTALSEREVVDVPNNLGITIIEGYAVPSSEKRSLFVEIDGHLHAATWGARRGDVAMIYGVAALNSGFTAMVPNWMLGNTAHHMRVVEVSEDQTTVWRGDKQVVMKVSNL